MAGRDTDLAGGRTSEQLFPLNSRRMTASIINRIATRLFQVEDRWKT